MNEHQGPKRFDQHHGRKFRFLIQREKECQRLSRSLCVGGDFPVRPREFWRFPQKVCQNDGEFFNSVRNKCSLCVFV